MTDSHMLGMKNSCQILFRLKSHTSRENQHHLILKHLSQSLIIDEIFAL
jgi:hypothetical protein